MGCVEALPAGKLSYGARHRLTYRSQVRLSLDIRIRAETGHVHGPDTPNPLQVSIRRGNADIQTVMADVLSLTKINFKTCLFNDRSPVTIRFADAIGDILVAAPVETEPRLPFKFYI